MKMPRNGNRNTCWLCSVSCIFKIFVGILIVSLFAKYQSVTSNAIRTAMFSSRKDSLAERRELENSSQLFVHVSRQCQYNKFDFKIMAEALQRGLGFYEKNVGQLVLDAALGTRIVEGQLHQSLKAHPNLPPLLSLYLKYMLKRAAAVSERIVRTVEGSQISSMEKQHTLPWVGNSTLWEIPEVGKWQPFSIMESYELDTDKKDKLEFHDEYLEESTSDACIYQLFNCETEDVTSGCADLFLKNEMSLYSLTHQVIYMLVAEKRSCVKNPMFASLFKNNDWKLFKENLCGKVWREANYIAKSKFPTLFRDLFIEQIGVCGMAGFPNFFRHDWLNEILHWQSKKTGCFPDPRAATSYPQKSNLNKTQSFSSENLENISKLSRRKRSESLVAVDNENCSVHYTAVGIVALSIHIRYYVDTCLSYY